MIDIEALAREAGLTSFKNICDGEWRGPKGSLAAYTNAVLEAAARECDEMAVTYWAAYKTAPRDDPQRANTHTEGKSDGASECAGAIRALKVTP